MAKTFNRRPVQVDTPDSKDIKNYFFNHYNWKGLADDKNVLAVDQETFSDCNNVYIDSEGLLRSRPSLKVKVVKYVNSGQEYVLSNVINVWTFADVIVYESESNGKYYLTFVNKHVANHIQTELKYSTENEEELPYKDVRLILANNKIFVFSEHDFNYYDIEKNIYASAEDFVYVPITSVVSGDKITTLDSPNILTKSYATRYLYDRSTSINFNELVGKDITVEIDGASYTINFVYNNEIVFVNRYTGLSEYNFADRYLLGNYGEGTPLVQVSERESMLVCSYNYTIESESNVPNVKWSIHHTVDGVTFTTVPSKDGIIGMPKISRDGFYAFIFRDDGPWVYSLLDTTGSTTGTKKYDKWTNLLETISKSTYDSWVAGDNGFHLNSINSNGTSFNQTTQVNGYFRDDTVFAFTYADNLAYTSGDPTYKNFYVVYADGQAIYRKQIFYTVNGTPYTYIPNSAGTTKKISFELKSSGVGIINHTSTSNNDLGTIFWYLKQGSITKAADSALSKIVVTQKYTTYSGTNVTWGDMTLTGHLKIRDANTNVIVEKDISFTKSNYAPVTGIATNISSYNSCTFEDSYFTYKIESVPDGSETISGVKYYKYYQNLTIVPKTISGTTSDAGVKLPTSFGDKEYFANTDNYMPNLYVNTKSGKLSVAIDFMVLLQDCAPYSPHYRGIYHIERDSSGETAELLDYHMYGSRAEIRTPIRDTCIVYDGKYTFVRLVKESDKQNIYVYTIQLSESSNLVANATKVTNLIFNEDYTTSENFYNQSLVLSDPQTYLLTNKYLFDYTDYTNLNSQYTPIKLLFDCIPVGHFYSGNTFDCIYLATKNALYVSNSDQVIEVTEVTKGETNFILPSADALLENYYLSKGNELYISKIVNSETNEFKWYFPEISKQTFDNEITNLQAISNSEVAVFFEDEVWHSTFDTETTISGIQGAYRYYKSKLQVGCKKGSDVLTTFDGKYTIFTSKRGLVAMAYQDFIASTEQSLTYLSDTIYDVFINYITEQTSLNQVKLFKFGYWIVIYKQDSESGFIFDTRNNSWWPISSFNVPTKLITSDDSIKILASGKMYTLNKLDIEYFDYDGKQRSKINWFVKSQKLHLNALNNYKHVSNITFVSVHDGDILQNTEYNMNELDFKLQVNCYRKRIDGNINEPDDYVNVNYRVDTIRTFVQRLNYSKVNEFQYQLSYDDENAIEIPLSLNSITIKYKIGGQVR